MRYPVDSLVLGADSVAAWGETGSGRARVRVNDRSVRVEPNGAFLGWLPVPAGPSPALEIEATLDGRTVRRRIAIRRPAPSAAVPLPVRASRAWARLRRLPSDTADSATQWRPVFSRWYPGGPLAVALPLGARLPVAARTADAVRLRLADGLEPWVAAAEVDTLVAPRADPVALGPLRVTTAGDAVELSVAAAEPLPSTVELDDTRLRWSIFDARHATRRVDGSARPMAAVERRDGARGRADVDLELAERPGGWRVRWRDGRMVLSVRRAWPAVRGLRGLIVALDAGHPPAGATGPTGLREDSVTLAVAKAAARRLAQLGARPVLVRPDSRPMSLDARVVAAEAAGAHVFVSIHVNAPADGRPPRAAEHAETFYSSPLALELATALVDSVAASTGQKALAPTVADLAVLRATWFPAVLIEGTCLVLPEREAWARTREGIEAYSEGIVAGLIRWASEPRRD